ncbi:Calcineurin-like phosphoesterase domain, apaH type-containing protein [Strongyloides ratti]|uniref:Calcineurin-like phosphoesterase domain, apaH type-containing protein n=1 Tax=Strongyloides ratti TaxID=34506 RepID=A0A090LUV3_STRRB|nr:Calcineurin-like phosphoesterase domain, apaH type-containing protein [Strongyloides ratti]CEF71419.1 Calcineurin-like phosphoesterase domain, apaH type-containing protein [Strongyloides ratti]
MLSPAMLKSSMKRSSFGDKNHFLTYNKNIQPQNDNNLGQIGKRLSVVFNEQKSLLSFPSTSGNSLYNSRKSFSGEGKLSDEVDAFIVAKNTRRRSMPVIKTKTDMSSSLLFSNSINPETCDDSESEKKHDIILVKAEANTISTMMPRKFENPQYPSPIRSLPSDPRRKLTKSGSFDYTGMNTKSYPASFKHFRRESLIAMEAAKNRRDSEQQGPIEVKPHKYTDDPTLAWEMLKDKRPVRNVRQMKLDTPIRPDAMRFVCIGCTHGAHLNPKKIPPGDVLIVCGDFTSCGLPREVKSFDDNLSQLKHPFKIIVAGNHECTFDDNFMKINSSNITDPKEGALKHALNAALSAAKITNPKILLTHCMYLQDSLLELCGIKIYGSPWQPKNDKWAFNLNRGQPLLDKWNQIPQGIDILITHTPPLGHGDLMANGVRGGCVELLNSVVKRIRPAYHVFGHIHEGYGCTSDGYTKFINCSYLNDTSDTRNNPVIFDIAVSPEVKLNNVRNAKKIMKKFNKT